MWQELRGKYVNLGSHCKSRRGFLLKASRLGYKKILYPRVLFFLGDISDDIPKATYYVKQLSLRGGFALSLIPLTDEEAVLLAGMSKDERATYIALEKSQVKGRGLSPFTLGFLDEGSVEQKKESWKKRIGDGSWEKCNFSKARALKVWRNLLMSLAS